MINKKIKNVQTMVGEDMVINGSVKLENAIIVYGQIKGGISTKGSVRLAKSAAVYGNNQSCPIKEDSPLIPSNVYGKTKKTIEEILTDLHLRKNWGVAILRYFNPVGAHHSGLIGENPISNKNNLFPIICEVAKNKNKKLFVYGNDWPTRDGTCSRDYIHVEDVIDGHEKALSFLLNSQNNFIKVNL